MIPSWQALIDSLNDPQQYHAMLVHLPIAVSFLGLVLAIGLLITRGKSKGLRRALVIIYILGAWGGYRAHEAGEIAHDRLDVQTMTHAASERFEVHEEMGENVWLVLAFAAGVTALTCVRPKMVRIALLVVTVAVALFAAGYVGITAHHGGMLVYNDGVGVPTSPNNISIATQK